MATVARIVVEHDADPDFSWLEQDMYNPASPHYEPIYRNSDDMLAGKPVDGEWYRDPKNHVALEMIGYDDDDNIVDSLGNIDFFADGDDWKTGTFHRLAELQACPYLYELARDMGLPE